MDKLLVGLLTGAVAGAVSGLLLTPKSGRGIRDGVKEHWQDVMEEGRRGYAERRAELEAQFAEAKRAPKSE